MNMKENDWVIANINNPEMNAGDFRVAGMDMDNTQMLSKDQYLQSDYIKNNPMFQDEQGDFQPINQGQVPVQQQPVVDMGGMEL